MRRKRIKKSHSSKGIIGCILFLCFVASSAYFFLFSSFFQIKQIDILAENKVEVNKIIQTNLEGKKLGISKKNILFASLEKIKADILDLSSEIESVIIEKKLPDFLGIEVKKHQNIGVWCRAEKEYATSTPEIKQCYDIDKKGIIYRESPIISGSLILNIYDIRGLKPRLKENIVSSEMINFIIKINKRIDVNNFEIISTTDLTAKTKEGWLIYFNSSFPAESQIGAMEKVLEELIEETYLLEYIDLRIDGRVYYR